MVQKIWAAITYIRHQRQIANTERIMRYMQRSFEISQSEAKLQLHNAVNDNLVERYTYVGTKGTKSGVEQEGFRIHDGHDLDKGSHDWYCYSCQKSGDVLTCGECWRVYHKTCVTDAGSVFICSICEEVKKKPRIKRKELNRLLSYTINRLKDKARELLKLFATDEEIRLRRFIYQPMDLTKMENKTKNRKYRYLEQFQADAQTIFHNVSVCYGEGDMVNLASVMIRDCKYDLDEIRQCKDCYHFSNAKPRDWFCQPCRPPHDLVYAKQKGFSFWPAKVIKITNDNFDVRFFGGWHQRAVVAKSNVKPITTNLRQLNIKKAAAGFNKACDELKRHQKLLDQQADEADASSPLAENDMEGEEEEEEEEEDEEIEPPKPKRFKGAEAEAISSSNVFADKPAPTPEDANVVTSSEDNVQNPRVISSVDTGTQTSKKLTQGGRLLSKGSQTDKDKAPCGSSSCKCDAKYNKMFNEMKERLENDHRDDKERDIKELRKDFEEDQQQAVSRAVAASQRDLERVRRQTEEKVKEQYMEELKKLAQKHKSEISQTKKKQWCYNCEEEAMYHCCWNTSYCSIKCQQEHWHREHKRCCRRKR